MTGVTQVQAFKPEVKQQTRQFVQQAIEQRKPEASGQVDQNRLSEELLEEVGRAGKVDPNEPNNAQGLESLLGALGQNFLDQRLGQAQPTPNEHQGKEGKKEKIIDWSPKVKKGEIIGAHAPIGEVVVRERSQPGSQGQGTVKGAEKAPKPQTAASSPKPTNSANPATPGGKTNGSSEQEPKSGEQTDEVQLSPESQQMAQQLAGQGLQVPGINDNQAGQSTASPTASGERIVQQGEVTTRCGGASQTVEVTPAGRIQPGDFLRIYRKLDDLPDDLTVGFKNKTGEEAIEEYRRKMEKGEVTRPLTVQQLEQLRFPTGNEK